MTGSPYLFLASRHPLRAVTDRLKVREAVSDFGIALRYQERGPNPPGAPEADWCETGHSIFILAGRIRYTFDDQAVEAGPGDMLHIPAGRGASPQAERRRRRGGALRADRVRLALNASSTVRRHAVNAEVWRPCCSTACGVCWEACAAVQPQRSRATADLWPEIALAGGRRPDLAAGADCSAEALWGEGFLFPGGGARWCAWLSRWGCRLRQACCCLAQAEAARRATSPAELGVWVSGFEANPRLALGERKEPRAGLGRRAQVEVGIRNAEIPATITTTGWRSSRCEAISPRPIAGRVAPALKPGGQFVLEELVADSPLHPAEPMVAAGHGSSIVPATVPSELAITDAWRSWASTFASSRTCPGGTCGRRYGLAGHGARRWQAPRRPLGRSSCWCARPSCGCCAFG